MEKIKKHVSIYQLKSGMVLAEEVRDHNTVLASPGVIVTESIINKLRENYLLNDVVIFSEESENSVHTLQEKSVEDIDLSFNELSINVEVIFEYLMDSGITDIDEIRNFAKRIQVELTSTRAVVKNIVLYGSGEDTIYRHCVNVAALSTILGKWIGLNEKELNLLTYSAILHDIGKTKIDPNIINKKAPLTTKEFNEIKNHPVIGYNLLKAISFLDNSVSFGILMHHERLDGTGYPLGMKEEKIHKFAKIIAIADVFDAVNSNRMHKKKRGPFEALEIISRESLGKLDYKFSRIFLSHVINYYIGENVLVNNHKICKIIHIDINNISRPLLLDGEEFVDLKHQKDLNITKLI